MMMIVATLFLSIAGATPCTDEDAYKMPGRWKSSSDDVAMADRSFPKAKYPALFKKADQAIALLKKAIPDPNGIEATAYRSVRGNPYTKNGAVIFGINSLYKGYYCVPDTKSYPEIRGTIQLGDETGTWIEVHFNSLDVLAAEKMTLGKDLPTAEGEWIFFLPRDKGELKGHKVLTDDRRNDAIVMTPERRSPYLPLSREQFLLAREKRYDRDLEETLKSTAKALADTQKTIASIPKMQLSEEKKAELEQTMRKNLATMEKGVATGKAKLEADRAQIRSYRESLSADERAAPAIVRSFYGLPGKDKIFTADGRALGTIDRSLFDAQGNRETIRLITIHWRLDEKDPAKVAVINSFKENFDFAALEAMLGR